MLANQIKLKDRMQLESLIATLHAGMSWILVRVTKYDLECESHNTITIRFPVTLNADFFVKHDLTLNLDNN